MEVNMPIIHVELVEGRTKEQKKQLGEAITKATVDIVKVPAEAEGYIDDAAVILNTEGLFSPDARTALTNVGTYIRRSLDVAR